MQVIGGTTVVGYRWPGLYPKRSRDLLLLTVMGTSTFETQSRINDQYRLCFRWTPEGPDDVELVDYH